MYFEVWINHCQALRLLTHITNETTAFLLLDVFLQ